MSLTRQALVILFLWLAAASASAFDETHPCADLTGEAQIQECFSHRLALQKKESPRERFLGREPAESRLRQHIPDRTTSKKLSKEARWIKHDREYREYRKSMGWFGGLLLEGASVKVHGGVTNYDGDSENQSGVRRDLDRTVLDAGFSVGFRGRRFARDIFLRTSEDHRRRYWEWSHEKKKQGVWGRDDFVQWAIMDALKLDLSLGYGTTLADPQGKDNSTTEARGLYSAKVTWEVPLGNLQAPKNPFD